MVVVTVIAGEVEDEVVSEGVEFGFRGGADDDGDGEIIVVAVNLLSEWL